MYACSFYNTFNYFYTVGGEVMVWNSSAPVCLSDFPKDRHAEVWTVICVCIAGAIRVAAQTDQRQGNKGILTKFGDNDRCSSVCQMSPERPV